MNQEFAEKISKLRRDKGMTQQELAGKLGVTNKAVSRWETGEGYPEVTLLVPLADALGVTVDHLLKSKNSELTDFNEKNKLNYHKEKLGLVDFLSFAMPLFSLLMFILLLCIPTLGRGLIFLIFLLFWGLSLYFRKNYYWILKENHNEEGKTTAWCNWYKIISLVNFFPIIHVVQSWVWGWLAQHNGTEILDALVFGSDLEDDSKVRLYYEFFICGVAFLVTFLLYKAGIYIVTKNARDVNQPIRALLGFGDFINVWNHVQQMKLFIFDGIAVMLFLFILCLNLDWKRIGFIKQTVFFSGDQMWLSILIAAITLCLYGAASFYFLGVLESKIPKLYILRNNVSLILVTVGFYMSGKHVFVVNSTGRIVDPDAVMNWNGVSSAVQLDGKAFAIFVLVAVFVIVIFNRQAKKSNSGK